MVFSAGQRLTAAQLNSLVPQVDELAAVAHVTSTTPITVLSVPVLAVSYVIRVSLEFVMGTTGDAVRIGLSGPSTSAAQMRAWAWQESGGGSGEEVFADHAGSLTLITLPGGSNWNANADGQFFIDAFATFSAAGTLSVTARENTGGNNFDVSAFGWLRAEQQLT